MRTSISSCGGRPQTLWPITCAAWSTPSNRTTSRRIKYFPPLPAPSPPSPMDIMCREQQNLRSDNSAPRKSILREYLHHFPTDPNALRLIARAALQQHGAPRAIDYLKPLADTSPPDAMILNL